MDRVELIEQEAGHERRIDAAREHDASLPAQFFDLLKCQPDPTSNDQ